MSNAPRNKSAEDVAKEAWDSKLRNAAQGDLAWDTCQRDHQNTLINEAEALIKWGPALAVTEREKALAEIINAHKAEVPEPIAQSPESEHSKAKTKTQKLDEGKTNVAQPQGSGGGVSRPKMTSAELNESKEPGATPKAK